jgi:hypothetical protein
LAGEEAAANFFGLVAGIADEVGAAEARQELRQRADAVLAVDLLGVPEDRSLL